MPVKIPNTYNAQTPLGQAVSNAMTAYFSNVPDAEDMAKAQYLGASTKKAQADAELSQQKLGASKGLRGAVEAIMMAQQPKTVNVEDARPSEDFVGPMTVHAETKPGMDYKSAVAANLPAYLEALAQGGNLGQAGEVIRAATPWQPNATQTDMDNAMLGAGNPYSGTQTGFEQAQANEIKKEQMQQAGQDRRAAQAVDKTLQKQQQAADLKQAQGDNVKLQGRRSVDATLAEINQLFDDLQAKGGAISTKQGTIANASNWIAARGGPLSAGTENQSIRNQIMGKMPLISQAIKNATGMSSQQLNSNFELQQFMKALADPASVDYEAAKKLLASLSGQFGTGGLNNGQTVNPLPGSEPRPSELYNQRAGGAPAAGSGGFTREQLLAEKERRAKLAGGQ